MQIWTASCASPVPPAFLDRAKPTLKCLRAHLHIAGGSDGSPVERGGPALHPARTLLTGFKMHTVNDLLTMYVGAASRHALRMTFVLEAESLCFDTEIVDHRSQLVGGDTTSPLFHLPLRIPRCSDTLQSHGEPGSQSFPLWWRSLNPRARTPCLRPHLSCLASCSASNPPLGAALRTHRAQKTFVKAIPQAAHKRLLDSPVDNPSKNPSTFP